MAFPASKTAGLGFALLLSGNAFALGLGEASGRAVLGQTLRLEIPVTGVDAATLAKNCFRLRTPRNDVGNDFVARHGRVDVVGTKAIVTTTAAVGEPVIGFALTATCGGELSREYVLLVGLPATAPAAAQVEPPRAARAEPQPQAPQAETPPAADKDARRIATPTTLEALARQKYPLQPKAREKFMRMMMAANPDIAGTDAPIAAGAELRVPAGLPVRRTGPYLGETKGAAPEKRAAAPAPQPAAEAPAKPEAAPAKAAARSAGKDRLVLGRAPESNEAKLLAEAERLAGLLVEQNKTQEDLTASIAKIEADYAQLNKLLVDTQTRLARIEAERIAEKQAAEQNKSSQALELLVAVLAGGALGGMGLHAVQRRRREQAGADIDLDHDISARTHEPPSASWSTRLASLVAQWRGKTGRNDPEATTVAAVEAPRLGARTPAPAAPPTPSTPEPAAAVIPARAAAPQAPLVPPWLAATTPAPAPAAGPAAVDTAAAIDTTPATPVIEPIVETPLPPAVVAEAPPAAEAAPAAEIQAEPPEPAAVLEPLDFAPVSITEQDAALAPVLPVAASPAATPPAQPPAAQEPLSLDFPEIKIPGAEPGDTLDFRKP